MPPVFSFATPSAVERSPLSINTPPFSLLSRSVAHSIEVGLAHEHEWWLLKCGQLLRYYIIGGNDSASPSHPATAQEGVGPHKAAAVPLIGFCLALFLCRRYHTRNDCSPWLAPGSGYTLNGLQAQRTAAVPGWFNLISPHLAPCSPSSIY